MNMCGYWKRQELRAADDRFGGSVYNYLTEKQGKAHAARQEEEDRIDPPCERCEACRAERRVEGPRASGRYALNKTLPPLSPEEQIAVAILVAILDKDLRSFGSHAAQHTLHGLVRLGWRKT